jgi:hypothetical protein
MMLCFLHRLLLAITSLAFLGGASLQAMPVGETHAMAAASTAMQTGMPCEHMAAKKAAPVSAPVLPCKGITADCIKQMGCIGVPDLPRADTLATPIAYASVGYRALQQSSAGVSHKPAVFPPIAI